MNYFIKYFLIVHLLLFSFCLCELSDGQKEKLLNGFIDYYNNLPNQIYQCNEGSLESVQQVEETTYQIVANIKVTEIQNVEATKSLKCTATVQDSGDNVTVKNSNCQEPGQQSPAENSSQEKAPEAQVEVTEPTVERKPVQLDNEVQSDTTITSGEQFIAIPRDQPSAPCIGCAVRVNPQAEGVSELANLGVRHLDIHEPSVKHSLDSVIDVERQVQVVSGVRYILTLSVNSNNCTGVESENCAFSKTCKITILEKPWFKLPNREKYRAILANNCTEEWLYGENGEVLPELPDHNNQNKGNTSVDHDDSNATDDKIQVKHNTDVQSQPNQERSLTDEEMKSLQEQIITNTQFQETTDPYLQPVTTSSDAPDVSKQHIFKVESGKHNENSIPVTEQHHNINLDKKKAIDDLLLFFDFSGFKPKTEAEGVIPRVRRSYDYDLQVLSLAKDFHGIKNSIENARFMYEMAQAMVDYLNEMDMEVKNRAVKNVVRAEEETENLQRFVYIQARVTIPCDKVECEPRDAVTQICNGVIDITSENSPQILNTFCYNDNNERDYRDVIREISLDDPVLQKLAEESVKKIEAESNSQYAMKINKIVSAITQITSGTLTKLSVIVENIKCNKSVPLALRINCTVLEQLGAKICEVIIHERHWLKERKISYTCTDRPVDMRISKAKSIIKNITVNDPKIIEMLQEAIQYLETQSNTNNKQKIVSIKSVSSQIIAGFLTKIEFVVGYTNCTEENYSRDELNKCELLKDETLRSCKAQIWDRSWIMDGRQVEVSCDDVTKSNEIDNTRKKRSIDFTGDQDQQSKSKDLEYQKMAIASLQKFMQSSSSRQHYKVIKVDKVLVQDVPGKLVKIVFSISPTNCQIENNGLLSSSKCNIVNPKNILHCRSKILENAWIDKKQYFVYCNIKDHEQQTNIDGLKERNPSNSKYYQLAEESLIKYPHDTGNPPDHKIVRVEKVTTQIVSGLLTSIDFIITPKYQSDSNNKTVRCHSKILEKHWLGSKDFNVSCEMKENNKIDDLVEPNVDNPKYMQIAVESLQKYIKHKPESHLVRVSFVDKVVQVGEIIKIRFIASHAENDEGDTVCYAEFSETKLSRSEIEVKCHLIGRVLKKTEITEEEQNYYKYIQLTDDSLHNYLQSLNSSQVYTIVSIESVTVQWDEGIKTLINFIISPIDLDNSESQGKQCLAEIREQPWLQKKTYNVKCELEKELYRIKRQDSHDRVRRPILGGITEQDPNKTEFRLLAEESLRKYTIDSGITQSLKVAHVEKVTTQVVAGSLTRIYFLVSGSQDSETFKCQSEVWEQPWLKKKTITVSCVPVNERVKRDVGMPGGVKEVDPTDPQYRALAEESLRKYTIDSGITGSLEVARVEKVTKQVVAGSLTRIDFLVSGSQDSESFKCHSKVWEQPWLKKKDITVSCLPVNERVKRDDGPITGGVTEVDPTDPQYRALAEESLRKYTIDSGITKSLKVAHVEKVTKQVVAGSLTRIDFLVSGSQDYESFKCHSEVWEQPWLKKKDITVSCLPVNERVKRDVGMPGGVKEVDPTDPQYRALTEESLRKYTKDSGITGSLEVAHVEKVTKQVVAGSLTRIDFLVSGSQDSESFKCHSKVWEQPWLKKKDITVSCVPVNERVKRDVGMPGGVKEVDPTDPQYRALAEESLRKYTIDSGITGSLEVARVEKVTKQVVAGSLTRIDFLVSGSQDSESFKCHSKVWEQPWLKKKDITVSCLPVNERVKRDDGPITGGVTEVDPTDPQYRALAEESLRKYTIDSGITKSLKVAHVEKVTKQVVAGSLTRIDFLVSASQDSESFKCHSEVWEQPWLKKKDITVSCVPVNERVKRDVGKPGGVKEVDPTDPQYRALAEESLRKYTKDSGISGSLEVAHVEKVTMQVVAGSLTRIDFLVSGSQDSESFKCHSKVWEQPWLKKKDITVSCLPVNERVKRDDGPITKVDPTDPQYRALAEESWRKYTIDSGITKSLKVAHVKKVTKQVVAAGSLTSIEFLVSSSQDSESFQCHSDVWERVWLGEKHIIVFCLPVPVNERVKRHIGMPGGLNDRDPTTPQLIGKESTQGNSSKNGLPVGILRGHVEEEQDPNKPEYELLAKESLHKYQKKSTVYHKVVEVKRVVTRVVSGIKYKIDFSAAPTACSVNVSSVRARSCKTDDNVILYCHSEIWDRPWLRQKKIDVQCYGPTDDNNDFDDESLKPSKSDLKNNNDTKYIKLAEEASEKYLTTSNRKYVHKVTEIHSVSEQIADDTLTNIDYSLSPTTCLRNETTNNTSCELKQPLIVFHCNAKIRNHPPWNHENEIEVTCKKNSKRQDKKYKRDLGAITIRQIGDDDNEIDEDTTYYYADRALQHINDKSNSNNLHKLISIHDVQHSVQMGALTVQMYIEVAETFCLRHHKSMDLRNCEEMNGLNHRLCFARLWPSPDDELVVRHVSVVCDDEPDFVSITGVNIPELLRMSIVDLERAPGAKFKLVHQGEPQVIPSLDSKRPFKINFIVATTNCSKDVNLDTNPFQCYINTEIPSKACHSFIWLKTETKFIRYINAKCTPVNRVKRSALDPANLTLDNLEIQKMVQASLEKLEMSSLHRYKQRVLQINSYSTKITSGKVTTIDFDVGYTACLKYEWVENITSCDFLEHLPRRRCVAQIWERLWINNGKNIDVNCVDDETPLESHIEFESAEMANELAREALKHIEAKYPHPSKQKVVRIFSLEKQVVAGIHYKMKIEVGFTDCVALSEQTDCKLLKNHGLNKFCRVNVWVRPWTDHPPNFRVSCDFQEGTTHDLYHHVQAEHLFYNFLTTYSPSYVNDYSQMQKRFEIFKNNIKKIHEFNVHEKGTAVYGVTRFSDLTYEEFSNTYMGLKTNLSNENQVPIKKADIPDIKIPANFDWREYDAVTEVKNQGSCGSCWAFSVTGNIEGQWKMQSGQLVSLSEQELVDCDKLDEGCNGGLPDNAYRAIEQMGGLELESDYPYEGEDDKCEFNKTLAKVQISGAVNITTNETGMAQWLVQNGPISIGINANAMQFYMGGISHPWKMLCNPTNLDHGVLIVGYGIKDYPLFHKRLPYWIVKNSWGKSWGEQGYYRVYRGDGTCGVNQMASSAVI